MDQKALGTEDQDFEQSAELQESNARGVVVIAELQNNVNSALEMMSELKARCADYDMQLEARDVQLQNRRRELDLSIVTRNALRARASVAERGTDPGYVKLRDLGIHSSQKAKLPE